MSRDFDAIIIGTGQARLQRLQVVTNPVSAVMPEDELVSGHGGTDSEKYAAVPVSLPEKDPALLSLSELISPVYRLYGVEVASYVRTDLISRSS